MKKMRLGTIGMPSGILGLNVYNLNKEVNSIDSYCKHY